LDPYFDGVIDRVTDGRGDTDDGKLTDSFRPKRAFREGDLDTDRDDFRNLLRRGNFVVHERGIHNLAVIKLYSLMEGVAETHNDAANDLPFDRQRVQALSGVMSRNDFSHLYHSGLLVHLYFPRLGRKFPSRNGFFSRGFVRQLRIISLSPIPASPENGLFFHVSVFDDALKAKRQARLSLRNDSLVFRHQFPDGNLGDFRG